jgi:acetyltransferase-like isoleucine patch superfamily enzyme
MPQTVRVMKAVLLSMRNAGLKAWHIALAQCADLEAAYSYPPNPNSQRLFLRGYLKARGVHFEGCIWVGTQFRIFGVGSVRLGNRCAIGNFSNITAHGPVSVGDDFLCSSHLVVNSGTHDLLTRTPQDTSVLIGNNVWVGTRVTIIGDTEIGDNCVIAAGSVVRGVFPANSLLGGVPAKVIKTLDPSPANCWRFFQQ